MRILFIGGTKRGYLTLKSLLENSFNVVGIISLKQDEHEKERFEKHIQEIAKKFRVPLYETKWLKNQNYAQLIEKEIKPDVALVIGCRILIKKEIYTIPQLGTLAVHDSLLPNYRGFSPLNWAIINGETETGVTLFYLSELMDGGDIFLQKKILIDKDDTAPQVYDKVCQATVDLTLESLNLLKHGNKIRIKQSYEIGSFSCSRNPNDGLIDWNKSTIEIYNLIRALTFPYPGAFTFYELKKITILMAKPIDNPFDCCGRIPGRVINVSTDEGYIDVLTGDGILRILQIEYENLITEPSKIITSVRCKLGLDIVQIWDFFNKNLIN